VPNYRDSTQQIRTNQLHGWVILMSKITGGLYVVDGIAMVLTTTENALWRAGRCVHRCGCTRHLGTQYSQTYIVMVLVYYTFSGYHCCKNTYPHRSIPAGPNTTVADGPSVPNRSITAKTHRNFSIYESTPFRFKDGNGAKL
jgi:hypothetical protein